MNDQTRRNRKYRLTLLVFFTITALMVFHRLPSGEYKEMVIWVVGLFMAGNGIDRIGKAIDKKGL
jgi:hypothetical protein